MCIRDRNKILKSYDKTGMLVGEAPCTKDLIEIRDHDFKVVSAVSIPVSYTHLVNAGLFFFHIFHDKFLAGQNFTIFEHGNYSMEFGKRL